jgi:hypothetical protein
VGLSGHHHHRRAQAERTVIFEKRQAIFAGHHHVGKDQIKALGSDKLERARSIVTNHCFVTRETKRAGQRCQRISVVVNDQQVRFLGRRLGLARHSRLARFSENALDSAGLAPAAQSETWNRGQVRSPPL